MSSVTCGNGVDMRTWSRTKSMFVTIAWCAPKASLFLPCPYWEWSDLSPSDTQPLLSLLTYYVLLRPHLPEPLLQGWGKHWSEIALRLLLCPLVLNHFFVGRFRRGKEHYSPLIFFFSNVAPKNEVCREKLIKSSAVISSSLLKVTCSMFIPLL